MNEWEREEGIACVVCPACAFTFDAGHTDWPGDGDTYSCPACAEIALEQALESATKALQRVGFVLAGGRAQECALDELHKQGYMSMGRSTP